MSAVVSGTDKANCNASDYTSSGSPSLPSAPRSCGLGVSAWSGISISFNNKPGTNQSACKGATVSIAYTGY